MERHIIRLSSSGIQSFFDDYLTEFEAYYSYHYLLLDKTFLVYVDNKVDEDDQVVDVTVITDYDYFLKIFKKDYPWNEDWQYLPQIFYEEDGSVLSATSWGNPVFGGSKGQKVKAT
ncbi:hypothetical protein PQ469_14730 [Mucilaginibacter sp. KACC 22773]|uniref:hypothetical protein n=1 Tax=Mucilaginibacter sp. KACC 22773 TaxID=3025671 RepID=UPI00236653ED|nr:hypothetical protein [Mucilaginibacter sp. KACC 22773]WDF81265.1 hypothetical protein PQ469_14730 [Mucilaginibacter sp. KACC 22773]